MVLLLQRDWLSHSGRIQSRTVLACRVSMEGDLVYELRVVCSFHQSRLQVFLDCMVSHTLQGCPSSINSTTMFRTLFRRDPWVQIPSPALFMGPYGNWKANIAFLSRLICASSETRLTLVSPFCKADCSYNGTR